RSRRETAQVHRRRSRSGARERHELYNEVPATASVYPQVGGIFLNGSEPKMQIRRVRHIAPPRRRLAANDPDGGALRLQLHVCGHHAVLDSSARAWSPACTAAAVAKP